MNLTWSKHKLQLVQPLVLSYGTFDFRQSYIVALHDQGLTGLGEGTAITYYHWTEEKIEEELHTLQKAVNSGRSIEAIVAEDALLPPVRNALVCAWTDLRAREEGRTLRQFYDIDISEDRDLPLTSITFSGQSIDDFELQLMVYKAWPFIKIKMASGHDLIILDFIASHPEKSFLIDANGGWNIGWIRQHRKALSAPNIKIIEQPFPIDKAEDLDEVRDCFACPIIADESCQRPEDLERCAGIFDGVNIKLQKCGGPDRAIAMIQRARQLDLSIMLGCMTESSVGITHAGHLLPLVDYADLDGLLLIANDLYKGVLVDEGKIILPEGIGLGTSDHPGK